MRKGKGGGRDRQYRDSDEMLWKQDHRKTGKIVLNTELSYEQKQVRQSLKELETIERAPIENVRRYVSQVLDSTGGAHPERQKRLAQKPQDVSATKSENHWSPALITPDQSLAWFKAYTRRRVVYEEDHGTALRSVYNQFKLTLPIEGLEGCVELHRLMGAQHGAATKTDSHENTSARGTSPQGLQDGARVLQSEGVPDLPPDFHNRYPDGVPDGEEIPYLQHDGWHGGFDDLPTP